MKSSTELQKNLSIIDRKGYPSYKTLQGIYDFRDFLLSIDYVQGDPFASPSQISVSVAHQKAKFPSSYLEHPHRRIALQDHLLRKFGEKLTPYSFKSKGSGKSGLLAVSYCPPQILKRTAFEITDTHIIIRLEAGFPANGRTVNSRELEKMLFQFIPPCVTSTLYYQSLNAQTLESVINLSDDQQYIRQELSQKNLTAFVADGSILPRLSGVSQKPMKNSIPFTSPDSLRVTFNLPHHGPIMGMGIPKGITLIAGGGYHGKSTLLNALELGVYNHIAGDGREYVITDDTALKLRAEDGRCIKDVDISLFINDLPNKKDTHTFSTPDASGSTSQAANLAEGIEAGSRVFLIDEDTSATNFMVRDELMQQVISRKKEPITPFLERVKDLYEKASISTILVAGSSGAYFHAADTIIQMDCYHPLDITEKAKSICKTYPCPSLNAPDFSLPGTKRILFHKRPHPGSRMKIKTQGKDGLILDKEHIDLRYVEQLVDSEQTGTLGQILRYAIEHFGGRQKELPEIIAAITTLLQTKGLNAFCGSPHIRTGYAMPRIQEVYACFNRYRE